MTVSGQVKGLKKGTLYLQRQADTILKVLDSTKVDKEGYYALHAYVESPEIHFLYLNKKDNNDINDRITFFGEPGSITINTSWNNFDVRPKITGSPTTEKLLAYRKVMSKFHTRGLALVQESAKQGSNTDSLQKLADVNAHKGYLYAVNYALGNSNSVIAPYIAVVEIPDANPKLLDTIYKSLTPEVATTKYGKLLKSLLQKEGVE